jgi:predicted glycosyltransferase
VPGETVQSLRSALLEARGLASVINPSELTARGLMNVVTDSLKLPVPASAAFNFKGAAGCVAAIRSMLETNRNTRVS